MLSFKIYPSFRSGKARGPVRCGVGSRVRDVDAFYACA